MHYRLVAIAATVQVLIICAMLLAVAMRKAISPVLARRRVRAERTLLETLSGWLAGEIGAEQLRAQLDSPNEKAVANVVRRASAGIGGERWSELSQHVRQSRWFLRMRAQARSRFWWRRLAAARCLDLVASNEDLPLINELLRDRDRRVRLAAVSVLRRVADAAALTTVLGTALTANPILQGYLFGCLQHHRAELSDLLPQAMSDDAAVDPKCASLRLMAQLGTPAFLASILSCADDPRSPVRRACAKALGSFPHPRSSAALRRLLADPDETVRAAAAGSLGRLVAVEACEDLSRSLNDNCRAVRLHAGLSLRLLGKSGSEALRRYSNTPDCVDPELPRYILGLGDGAIRGLASAVAW